MTTVTLVILHASEDNVSQGWAANVGDGIPGVLTTDPDPETGLANLRVFISSPAPVVPFLEGATEGTDPGQWSRLA